MGVVDCWPVGGKGFVRRREGINHQSTRSIKDQMGKSGKNISFKDQFTFEERCAESQDIIAKYPDRLPAVVEKYPKTDLPDMEKKKFLVPRDMSVGQFIHILGGRLHLAPGKALFVFVENTLPQTSSLMQFVYESYKDEDGFLYMCYSSEKTFGR